MSIIKTRGSTPRYKIGHAYGISLTVMVCEHSRKEKKNPHQHIIITSPHPQISFLSPYLTEGVEQHYLAIREQEGRVYEDEVLARLPQIDPSHRHAVEWAMRGQTMGRLLSYLKKNPSKKRLLDLGCGNGWLTRHVAELSGREVLALDMNRPELEQAARVFPLPNVTWAYGDIFISNIEQNSFDLIYLTASVQYFPDFSLLIKRLKALLAPGGEIHILDSPFYPSAQLAEAAQRSEAYYRNAGFPAMALFYHHHSLEELREWGPRCLYNPNGLYHRALRMLGKPIIPFAWWKIG